MANSDIVAPSRAKKLTDLHGSKIRTQKNGERFAKYMQGQARSQGGLNRFQRGEERKIEPPRTPRKYQNHQEKFSTRRSREAEKKRTRKRRKRGKSRILLVKRKIEPPRTPRKYQNHQEKISTRRSREAEKKRTRKSRKKGKEQDIIGKEKD